jgi:putative transposase
MKRSRLSAERIIVMLKEREAGIPTVDVCRKYGLSTATCYQYKAKYDGLKVSDARRLQAPQDENGTLKKALAEAMLDNAILKDVVAKKLVASGVRREAVVKACATHGVSRCRACQALAMDRSSVPHFSVRPDDFEARAEMNAVAGERWLFGYPLADRQMEHSPQDTASM